ncbi:MAG TPA: AAA family ATPase [Gemmatimonadaceae bacterium]|nr:AAA family ATPase [Gemmatimonadaceae bacterium]
MRADLLPTIGPKPIRPLLVASGKGGVGTSVTASLVALTAVERGERVLLVDATEGAGMIHQLFGLRPERSLWQLYSTRVHPNEVVLSVTDQFSVVAGGSSAGAEPPQDDQRRRNALSRIGERYAEYDVVVIDGGSRLDTLSAVAELVDARLLLVTSADRFALAANYAVVKAIGERMSDIDRFVLVNRHADSVAADASTFLSDACAHFLSRTVRFVGALPDDTCLQAAIGAGMSLQDALDGSPAAIAMRGILPRFVPAPLGALAVGSGAVVSPLLRRWS